MSSEEEQRSASRSEGEGVAEEEGEGVNVTLNHENHQSGPTAAAKKDTDKPNFINRRSKLVNGIIGDRKTGKTKHLDKKSTQGNNTNTNNITNNKKTRQQHQQQHQHQQGVKTNRTKRNVRRQFRERQEGSDSGLGEGVTSPGSESEPARSGSEKSGGGKCSGRASGEAAAAALAAKKKEMARLQKELEQEMRYRDTIQWSVAVLEQSVDELQQQLEAVTEGQQEEGGEFKLRFEAQEQLNAKLEEQTEWYLEEVDKTKEKIKRGQEYTFDQDLDQYNEFELLKMVKSLERERNNLYSDLRGKSWVLDNQSKEYYHLKELIRAYTGDLTMINRSLEQLWRQRGIGQDTHYTGGSTPVTSPGGVRWSGQSGIRPSQRILDPRKGPIRKTAGVRSLPRLDQDSIDHYSSTTLFRKARSRSRGRSSVRTKSLDTRKEPPQEQQDEVAPLSPVLRAKSEEGHSVRSSSGVFDESYEASNEASTTASVELGSDRQ
ncbi:hypothetical protein Pmani_026214 [Petrolisthes manimaculis]|uniref:Uncharacterized protein n=1 Tax=Petrolisthes manimaculis TaxID=1843537 RepID=A0AAE1TY22_9EUCA|nr:hypothetical protein Pmani_026214 [Petrolisthes manimaculis]